MITIIEMIDNKTEKDIMTIRQKINPVIIITSHMMIKKVTALEMKKHIIRAINIKILINMKGVIRIDSIFINKNTLMILNRKIPSINHRDTNTIKVILIQLIGTM